MLPVFVMVEKLFKVHGSQGTYIKQVLVRLIPGAPAPLLPTLLVPGLRAPA